LKGTGFSPHIKSAKSRELYRLRKNSIKTGVVTREPLAKFKDE
jgi:hypothetical protein